MRRSRCREARLGRFGPRPLRLGFDSSIPLGLADGRAEASWYCCSSGVRRRLVKRSVDFYRGPPGRGPSLLDEADQGIMPSKPAADHRLNVVLDTGVYRSIGGRGRPELWAREQEVGVLSLASTWPCREVLARCLDEDLRNRRRALAAVRAIWHHCGIYRSDRNSLRVHDATDLTITSTLFGVVREDLLAETGAVSQVLHDVAHLSGDDYPRHVRDALELIRQDVERQEYRFRRALDTLAELGQKSADLVGYLSSAEGTVSIAETLVSTLGSSAGVAPSSAVVAGMGKRLAGAFPVAVEFMRSVIIRRAQSGARTGHAAGNDTWDLKLAFHAGPGASVSGRPTVLVSNDRKGLHAAAAASGVPERVLDLPTWELVLADEGRLSQLVDRLSVGSRE